MDRVLRTVALVGTGGFAVAVVLTVIDIALRTVSEFTVYGLVDLVKLFMMVGAMLAIPFGFVDDQHVSIDVFTARLSGRTQRALQVFGALLGVVFLSGVFWFSLQQMLVEHSYGDRSQSIGIPMIYYWVPLVTGMGLAVIANIWLVYRILTKSREDQP